jgi:hypothetical protein
LQKILDEHPAAPSAGPDKKKAGKKAAKQEKKRARKLNSES